MQSYWMPRITAYLHSEPRFQPRAEYRLLINGQALGWASAAVARALQGLAAESVVLQAQEVQLSLPERDYAGRSRSLQAIAEGLRAQNLVYGWRAEPMVVYDTQGQALAETERALFRTFGLRTHSAHLNAFVMTPEGPRLWVAKRSEHKAVDPGMLDNLVGGGVTGGESIGETLTREAWEEAGLELPRPPRTQAQLYVLRNSGHGIQDELVHVHDLWLKPDFAPFNRDGEVAGTDLVGLPDVTEALIAGRFTRDAGLVVLDGLCRQLFFGAETAAIQAAMRDYGIYG